MKDQYFGDINDYLKYGLLLALSDEGRLRTGVCWMLTSADGRTDGSSLSYLHRAEQFRDYAPTVFDFLHRAVIVEKDRRVARFEESSLLPNAVYHSPILPDRKEGRIAYFGEAVGTFRHADWVFFDPDNGLEVPSILLGRKGSSKFLYWAEAVATYRAGKSVLIYQHFPRKQRTLFVKALAKSLAERTGARRVLAFQTTRVVFFLAPQRNHLDPFRRRAAKVESGWGDQIVVTEHSLQ